MKSIYKMRLTRSFLILALSLLAAFSVYPQTSRQIAVERRIETMNRQAKDYERDEMNREISGKPANAQTKRSARVVQAEIEEDLKTLQNQYNKVVAELQLKNEISDAFAKESALLVRKHATRLKENLSLPKPTDDQAKPPDSLPIGTRKTLSGLCRHIYEFITNPMFERLSGIDVQHSAKARQDLESIILLAEMIVTERK